MKRKILFFAFSLITPFMLSANTVIQSSDTLYLNTTHVMTAQGQIIANTITNRINYKLDGSNMLEEKVVTNMSYPEENGETHVNISTEEFTVINGDMTFFKGEYNENDSITVVMAEKDGDDFLVSGKTHGESSFQLWDQQKFENIDAFVVYFDTERLKLTKKVQVKRMYDLYGMELRNNNLSKLGEEKITLAGQEFDCFMVKFDYGLIKGKIWFAKDKAGNAFLVKEEAQSQEYGPFDLDMTDYNTNKPINSATKEGEFGF